MKIVSTFAQAQSHLLTWREEGQAIALVPTMGNLHAGHMRLVEKAKGLADRTIVSIFVNPLQFSAGEDFKQYPHTPQEDQQQLQRAGVDLLFAPSAQDIYPTSPEDSTFVEVPEISHILCGRTRKNHFRGVATIVLRLVIGLRPSVAIFGKKDYQQYIIICKMVSDFGLDVNILGIDTVREKDGVAMSSRNRYLSAEERLKACNIYQALGEAVLKIQQGAHDFREISQWGKVFLQQKGLQPEYFSILTQATLAEPGDKDQQLVCLAAARLGSTRLIDNIRFARNG